MTNNFKYTISSSNEKEWQKVLSYFSDANIYQTISFNKYSVGGDCLEQFQLIKNGELVGAALVRIKTLPIIKRGVAYIRWAPMYKTTKSDNPNIILQKAIEFLYDEYVINRKLVLRITSNLICDNENDYSKYFEGKNFRRFLPDSKSILLDLTKDLDELRSGLRKKWRYSLKQSEKQNQQVERTNDPETFKIFKKIYSEMHSRKKFDEFVNIDSIGRINNELLPEHRMQIFICYENNTPLAGMIVTDMGDTGIYLLGGSTARGLELGSSYLLQWEVIKWLKLNGVRKYDLGGIDKDKNPGVFTFKSGLGGTEITYAGAYEAKKNLLSTIILRLGEKLIK